MGTGNVAADLSNFRLQVYCNFAGPLRDHGWAEVYWLLATDLGAALAAGYDFCNRRRLWYGSCVRTEYASVFQGRVPLDTWAIDISQISAFPPNLPQPQPPHDPWVGLNYDSGTAGGRWGFRTWKGVPDDWIYSLGCTRPGGPPRRLGPGPLPPITLGPAGPGTTAPLLLGPGQTLDQLQRSLPDALVTYAGFLTVGKAASTVAALDDCSFARISKRDPRSDQPWRRVSCEPGACCIGGYWVSSAFDFCGMCVGVARACYWAPCRWYVGGPLGGIRFYRIPPTNPVYYGQLRFGPKNMQSGYWNTLKAGEITSIPADDNRHFYDGTDVSGGARDGTHPDVTAQEAAGQAPWPWPAIFAA